MYIQNTFHKQYAQPAHSLKVQGQFYENHTANNLYFLNLLHSLTTLEKQTVVTFKSHTSIHHVD